MAITCDKVLSIMLLFSHVGPGFFMF